MFFWWDPTYMLYMLPGLILVMLAQFWVNRTYQKWSKVRNQRGISGSRAARELLSTGGLYDVKLEPVRGRLRDHYDPRSKTLRLSRGVAEGESVAALAIAAHEIGHAVQDQQEYAPLRFRAAIVPAVNIGSYLGMILIVIGLMLQSAFGTQLAWLGVGAFGLGAVLALATLPVELNASARARELLKRSGLATGGQEMEGVSAVLNAAALTYVAALAAAILQLLYWVSLVAGAGGRRRR